MLCVWVWSMHFQFSREINVPIVKKFTMMNLHSHLTLFSRDVGQASTPQGSGPDIAEAQWSLKLWELQIKPAKEFEKGMASSNLLDQDVLFLESSDPADSILLVPYSQDEADVVEKSLPATLTYEELLDVIRSGLGMQETGSRLWRTQRVVPVRP